MNDSDIQQAVQQKYGEIAAAVKSGGGGAVAAPPAAPPMTRSPATSIRRNRPPGFRRRRSTASLGCGNPTALIDLHEGETVLDLGSGGGIDVLLSARRVGATGKVYGLDMTDEMLELARDNQRTGRRRERRVSERRHPGHPASRRTRSMSSFRTA